MSGTIDTHYLNDPLKKAFFGKETLQDSAQSELGKDTPINVQKMFGPMLAKETEQAPSLLDAVGQGIQAVNEKQQQYEQVAASVLAGKMDNIHSSMIALAEANAAFSLMIEVRNKLLEAHKEISQMSV